MELLLLSRPENIVDEPSLLSRLLTIAAKLEKEFHFYPLSKGRKQSEASIGDFLASSDNLTFYPELRDVSGLPKFSVIDRGNDFFDLAAPNEKGLLRLGILQSENMELLNQFCREYLILQSDHLLSIEGSVDKFMNPLNGAL
jgi:hypothetical protein